MLLEKKRRKINKYFKEQWHVSQMFLWMRVAHAVQEMLLPSMSSHLEILTLNKFVNLHILFYASATKTWYKIFSSCILYSIKHIVYHISTYHIYHKTMPWLDKFTLIWPSHIKVIAGNDSVTPSIMVGCVTLQGSSS